MSPTQTPAILNDGSAAAAIEALLASVDVEDPGSVRAAVIGSYCRGLADALKLDNKDWIQNALGIWSIELPNDPWPTEAA